MPSGISRYGSAAWTQPVSVAFPVTLEATCDLFLSHAVVVEFVMSVPRLLCLTKVRKAYGHVVAEVKSEITNGGSFVMLTSLSMAQVEMKLAPCTFVQVARSVSFFSDPSRVSAS